MGNSNLNKDGLLVLFWEELVGVEEVVAEAMGYIDKHCPQQTDVTTQEDDQESKSEYRVPPVMVASLSRSGKTTTLKAVFNKLLQRGNYTPLYVTFNESSNFRRNKGETDHEAFLRIVTAQVLMMGFEAGQNLVCQRNELEAYLNTAQKPVVLLVDELDTCASPVIGRLM